MRHGHIHLPIFDDKLWLFLALLFGTVESGHQGGVVDLVGYLEQDGGHLLANCLDEVEAACRLDLLAPLLESRQIIVDQVEQARKIGLLEEAEFEAGQHQGEGLMPVAADVDEDLFKGRPEEVLKTSVDEGRQVEHVGAVSCLNARVSPRAGPYFLAVAEGVEAEAGGVDSLHEEEILLEEVHLEVNRLSQLVLLEDL